MSEKTEDDAMIEITEEMIFAAAEVLEKNRGWVFGFGSAQALAKEMLQRALEARFEGTDESPLETLMSYDSKSYELAEHFLADEPRASEADKRELAQQIQNTVEDFFFDLERRAEASRLGS